MKEVGRTHGVHPFELVFSWQNAYFFGLALGMLTEVGSMDLAGTSPVHVRGGGLKTSPNRGGWG